MLAIIILVIIRILKVVFFAGLAGCLIVIVASWGSIFKSEFFGETQDR